MSSSTPPPSKTDAPVSSTPGPGSRNRRPISILIDDLHGLTLLELDDVHRFIKRLRAARGDQPSPELVSEVVAAVGRLRQTYSKRIPISLVRAGLANIPRALLDLALFEAETRHLLRIEPVQLPAEFVEVGAGIQHDRGLLYWIVPFLP